MPTPLEELELDISNRRHEEAARKLIEQLNSLDANHGSVGQIVMSHLEVGLDAEELDGLVATRLANAIGQLFTDPGFTLSEEGFYRFITVHRWIGTLFAASPLRNADHVIRALGCVKSSDGISLDFDHSASLKACVLYSLDSSIKLNCDELWFKSPRTCAALLMGLLSPRLTISRVGHAKREQILAWLPTRLDQLQSAAAIPQGFIHDVWMHCSYSLNADKHAIKGPLNRLVRRQMLDAGITDVDTEYASFEAIAQKGQKPVLLVMVEWFHSNHSVYRTHSRSLIDLKRRFHLVGAGITHCTDEWTRALFDEFVPLDASEGAMRNVKTVTELAMRLKPQMVYYLGVGMFPHTIYAANLRLAPIQCVGLGHGASTFAPQMDYFLIDEDYVGDVNCFSEKVIALPIGSMPFTLPEVMPQLGLSERALNGPVRIAVAATSMKVNPAFLAVCRTASELANHEIEFRFTPGFAVGLTYRITQREIERQVPGAVVNPHMPYASYLAELQSCDMFVNPFPYGNMNTIVDTVLCGLDGVCWRGPEPHSTIDPALFLRLGYPGLKIVESVETYAEAIVSMAREIRHTGRRNKPGLDRVQPLMRPAGRQLADLMWDLQLEHPSIKVSSKKLFRLRSAAT